MITFCKDSYAEVTGFTDENQDCSVRAFAAAACLDYQYVHGLFYKHGRRNGRATPGSVTAAVLAEQFPSVKREFTYCRLAAWVSAHPKGHYVVHVNKHALAVVDGVVYDWKLGPNRIVKSFVKLV